MIGDYLVNINGRYVRRHGYVFKGAFISDETGQGMAGNLLFDAVTHKPILDPGVMDEIRTKDPGKAKRIEKKLASYQAVDIPALQEQARLAGTGQDPGLAPLIKLLRDKNQELWEACVHAPDEDLLEARLARGDMRMNPAELEYVTERAMATLSQHGAEYMQNLHKIIVAAGSNQPLRGPNPIEFLDFMRRWDNTAPTTGSGVLSILLDRLAFVNRPASRLENEAAMIKFVKDRAAWTGTDFGTAFHSINAGLGAMPLVADTSSLEPHEIGVRDSISHANWVERFRRQMNERDPDTGQPIPYSHENDLMRILPRAVEVENWLRDRSINLVTADTARLLSVATGQLPDYTLVKEVLDPANKFDPDFTRRVMELAPHAQMWHVAEEDVLKIMAISQKAATKDFMTDWFDAQTGPDGKEVREVQLDGLELPDGRTLNMPGYRIVKPAKNDPRITVFANYVASCMHLKGPMPELVTSLLTSESAGVLYLMRDGISEPVSFLVGVQGKENKKGQWGLGFGAWTSTDNAANDAREDIMDALSLHCIKRDDAAMAAQGKDPRINIVTIGIAGFQNTARTFKRAMATAKQMISPRRPAERVQDMIEQGVLIDRTAQLDALRP